MSTSLWIILLAITALCVVIFKKTVSNDAENDFKIRDILSNSDMDTDEEIPSPEPQKMHFEQSVQVKSDVEEQRYYEEKPQNYQQYETKIHNEPEPEPKVEKTEYTEEEVEVEEEKIKTQFNRDFRENIETEYSFRKRGLFDFVSTFWRGITFTIGMLVCLYSLFGIIKYVQTSNDAIIYSIWLLIGVILIK